MASGGGCPHKCCARSMLIGERVGFSQCDVEPEIQLLCPAGVGDHELPL